MTATIPADIARCPGVGSDSEGWRDGCDVCLRRTAAPTDHPRVSHMQPPAVMVFECEFLIEPKARA